MDGSRLGVVFQAGLRYIRSEPNIRTVRFRDYRQLKLWNRQYGRELLPGTSKSPCRVVGGDRPLSSPEP